MPVHQTSIEGLLTVTWPMIDDDRGFFLQTYQYGEMEEALGRPFRMRQGNHSRSAAGVLRGFHLEPWDKFIYVPRGRAMCIVADVRPDSETFGRTEMFLMGDVPHQRYRLFIAQGLANAFYSIVETDYLNDVSEPFDPANRRGVIWNDPTLAVAWPTTDPVLSENDRRLPTLAALLRDHPRQGQEVNRS